MFLGVLILLLGVLLLLQQLDIIRGGVWEYFWPAAVIAIGISMIVKHRIPKK
ncbi:MAG: hypothetical protein IIA17_03560 [candidate division Zixibacteria bacterium]|nr:hypothetical protein [candidate division Zixibacteria bacterium]